MFSNLINSQKSIKKIVDKSLRLVFDLLDQFSGDPLFIYKIEIAFGSGANADAFKTAWSRRSFSDFPPIEIRSAAEINGANGAFSITTGKIYLAQEFITANAKNLNAIASVLLEEYGHYVDSKINVSDAAGDEGNIFARLVQRESISQQELAVLKAEDDTATVTLDGKVVEIEQANGTFGATIVAKTDDFTVNDGGWNSFDEYPRQVADVNGDGRADIVAFGDDDVLVALGQANGTFGATIVAKSNGYTVNDGGWTSFDRYPRQVADVNGDGRADIVAFGYDAVFVALGQANGTFGAGITAKSDNFTVNDGGWTSFNYDIRQVADVNGDGRADIVAFGYDDVLVALGQANGTFGATIVAKSDDFTVNDGGWNSFDEYPRQVADVNGDGRADIVAFGYDDVFVALGQANGTFGATIVAKSDDFTVNDYGWTSFNYDIRQVADVNGDGNADIIGFSSDAVYVALADSGNVSLPTLAINNVTITEGNSGTKNATFTVTRTGTATNPITVNYSTANGTTNPATAGSDYTATTGTLNFATTETSKTITVQIIGDTTVESNETFFVNLSGATNATIADDQGLGTITNDDAVVNNSFTQMLDALGAFESGKLSGDPLQYVAINQLHFVGKYQFGEALLEDLGYYNGDNTPYPGSSKNDWIGGWTGKDGVSKLGLSLTTYNGPYPYYPNQTFDSASFLGNVTAQENAIRQAFGNNITSIYSQLESRGKSIDEFLGQTRSYQTGNLTISMSGILAGAHLRGATSIVNYLVDGTVTPDENGTPISQYIHDYGGYETPFGTNAANTLTGTQYNDVLVGFGGNDNLTGGAGADKFRFYSANDGIDTITDFNPAEEQEKIELYQQGFKNGSNLAIFTVSSTDNTLSQWNFSLGSSATDSSHRIIYNDSTGDLFFDPDGTGSQTQVKFAQLDTGLNLSHTDFVVF